MNKINRKSLCKFPFNFASFPWSSCSAATRSSTATTAMVNLNQTLVGGQLFPMQATKIDAGIRYWKRDSANWLLPYSSGHSLSPLSSKNLNRCGMVYQYLNDAQKSAQITSVINGMKTNGQCWSKWKRASMVSLYSVQSGADMAGEEQSSDSSAANRKDIGWKYAYLKNIKDRNSVTCKFCDKTTNGGISRHKKHLVGSVGLGVTKCTKCPSDVREEIMQSMVERKNEKEKAFEEQYALKRKANFFDDSDDEEDAVDVQECGIGGSRHKTTQAKSNKKGPMDLFVTKKKAHATARQTSIVDAYDKEARKRVCRDICRFLYHGMIPFNVLNLEAFKKMVQSIGEYGPNLKTPSCYEARVPFLNDEVQYTKDLLKENVSETEKYGCSILSDGWSDRRGRTLINIIVNNAKGSMFMESFDASNTVKSGTLLFHFLDDFVERVGEKNVLQVVTDNGSNYVLAGKMLQNKRKNLFWTPCAAHSIDLMLEDIGKIPIINKTITRAGALVTFIYGHPSVLALMRTFTNDRELSKHGITRFATNFLTLQSLQRRRRDLRKMFVSEEWSKNMWSKDSRGKAIRDTVFQISFWGERVDGENSDEGTGLMELISDHDE